MSDAVSSADITGYKCSIRQHAFMLN